MIHRVSIVCLLALLFWGMPNAASSQDMEKMWGESVVKLRAENAGRGQLFDEGNYAMFIHWGLYSQLANKVDGVTYYGIGEWIMNKRMAGIPVAEYKHLAGTFNPQKFDAKAIARLAKDAGMKYIVITSKHHDGFCLFNSEHTGYDMAGTPYDRDLLKPLAEECHRQGLKICWYHSIMDWHHPKAKGETFPEYVEHMKKQCRELLTNYGEIGVMWFDGEWIGDWSPEQGVELEKYLRDIQPSLIVNNRVGKRKRSPGDFGTPEQKIPATGMPGWDWETCMTINRTWGHSKHDHNWKPTEDLVRKLIDVASKGGNFLLNVGPTAEGLIPQPSVERLEGMGRWLSVNGEAIHGTRASVLTNTPWGRCTTKPGKLYLHVFQWPGDRRLQVPELKTSVKRAYLLADPKQKTLVVQQDDKGTTILVPKEASDPVATVMVVELAEKPEAD
jgi:alpha-L-fucosidase